jgi:hypothetical protein
MLTILTPLARADDNNQVGRYQLVAADVDHSGTQTVFKIDTATGQAWTYTEADLLDKKFGGIHVSQRYWSIINEQVPTGPTQTTVGR